MEHAYRQSVPDTYGIGLGMMGGMGGGQGINNLPGSNTLLYGRGMGYGGVSGLSIGGEHELTDRQGVVCVACQCWAAHVVDEKKECREMREDDDVRER